jgi:hypothetical protein
MRGRLWHVSQSQLRRQKRPGGQRSVDAVGPRRRGRGANATRSSDASNVTGASHVLLEEADTEIALNDKACVQALEQSDRGQVRDVSERAAQLALAGAGGRAPDPAHEHRGCRASLVLRACGPQAPSGPQVTLWIARRTLHRDKRFGSRDALCIATNALDRETRESERERRGNGSPRASGRLKGHRGWAGVACTAGRYGREREQRGEAPFRGPVARGVGGVR